MTAETVPYVDSNKQLRDSHITRTADKTIITSNLEVTGNIFVSGNSYAINSENTVINDRIIGLANNNTSTTLDVGLMLQYPQKNVAMIHHGTTAGSPHNGQLTLGYTQSGFEVDNITKDPSNNLTLNVWGHVVTQNNITVGAQGSYYGDGTTLTGVALSADLTDNVTRISALETATIISNSSTITTGFTKGDIIYASADNVLNKLSLGTNGQVLKSDGTDVVWGTDGGGSGSGSTPWVTNGNKIHYPTDNVGINVSDPAFKLDVHGTANVGALTATSLSVGGQTLALASDLTANATRVDALYTATAGDIIYADGTNSLAKLSIGSANQVLTVQGGLPAWVNASGGGGGGGSSQWSNVTLDEVYFDGNVGIANTNPGHDLSVGSNLFVDDDGSNVLVVTGNTAMSSLTLGQVSIAVSYGLNDILNVSNTSSNIMQLTNATTGLVATGNVHALKFIGDGSGLTGITSNLDQIVNNGNVTSNTVQFSNATTGLVATANVEVGGELTVSGNATVSSNLTVSGNVSDLNVVSNVNMLHTGNTAAIKLNSNVVAEFPRSKKLIKYPRVALGTNASPYSGVGSGSTVSGYTIKASGEYDGNLLASKAFTGTNDANEVDAWLSISGAYSSNTPVANSATLTKFGQQGSWLEIKLPNKIKLSSTRIFSRRRHITERNDTADIWASNTGTDGDWVKLATINFNNTYTDTIPVVADIDTPTYYQYFAIQITRINWSGTYANIGEWELFGTPEYDPEAHGTDVTVKSYPNVPNTDWLEVYYDAKGLAVMPNPVPDETANNRDGVVTGASLDTTGGIESFAFNGVNQTITLSDVGISGGQALSMSGWLKVNSAGEVARMGIGTYTAARCMYFTVDNSISAYYIVCNAHNNVYTGTFTPNTWIHVNMVYTGAAYLGGYISGTTLLLYINGKLQTPSTPAAGTTPLNLPSPCPLRLGRGIDGGYTAGSIANFRLFNRALTSDEIYQLYAYQKEYFGLGDLSMTLKAGRLGIGTSEPRAALDVRGGIYAPGTIVQVKYASTPLNNTVRQQIVGGEIGDAANDIDFLEINFTPKFTNSSVLLHAMVVHSGPFIVTLGFKQDGYSVRTQGNNTNSPGGILTQYDGVQTTDRLYNEFVQVMIDVNGTHTRRYTVAAAASWNGGAQTVSINDRSNSSDMRSISNFTVYEIAN